MISNTYDAITRLNYEHQRVMEHFAEFPSLKATVDDVFKKTLLLGAASSYETEITNILIDLYKNNCSGGCVLPAFVQSQALERQYFKLFDWNDQNANKLFGLFGVDFKKHMKNKVKENRELDESIRAFLELGRLRNEAVHKNLVIYTLDKNAKEVFELYERARLFVKIFSDEIHKTIKHR